MKTTVRTLSALTLLSWASTAAATQAPPGAPLVPALGTTGWVALSLLLLGAGFVVLRRRPPK